VREHWVLDRQEKSPGTGRKQLGARVFRPVPGLPCLLQLPTSHDVGYTLLPSGLSVNAGLAAVRIVTSSVRFSE